MINLKINSLVLYQCEINFNIKYSEIGNFNIGISSGGGLHEIPASFGVENMVYNIKCAIPPTSVSPFLIEANKTNTTISQQQLGLWTTAIPCSIVDYDLLQPGSGYWFNTGKYMLTIKMNVLYA